VESLKGGGILRRKRRTETYLLSAGWKIRDQEKTTDIRKIYRSSNTKRNSVNRSTWYRSEFSDKKTASEKRRSDLVRVARKGRDSPYWKMSAIQGKVGTRTVKGGSKGKQDQNIHAGQIPTIQQTLYEEKGGKGEEAVVEVGRRASTKARNLERKPTISGTPTQRNYNGFREKLEK